MASKPKYLKSIFLLLFLSYLFFILGNSIVALTSPDEVFYAQIAKEMLQRKNHLTPYIFGQPNFEKPIFTYWLLEIGFLIFGITSFAARFFPAVFASIGVIALYFLGLIGFKDEKKAFICSLILMSCGLYIGLARTVFTDMIFSVFILLALTAFFWGYCVKPKKGAGLLLFFFFSGLAILTKGPLGLLIPLFTVVLFLIIQKDIKFLFCKYSLWGLVVLALVSFPWYIFEINKYGYKFVQEFFYNDHIRRIIEAEHIGNDKWYFYPLSMFGCMFPWSLFVAASLIFLPKCLRHKDNTFHRFIACWISVVFLIFEPAHSKLVSYIFPLFPALALSSGDFIYRNIIENNRERLFSFALFGTLFILFLIPLAFIFSLAKFSEFITSKIPIYCFMALSLALALSILSLVLRKKLSFSIYVFSLVVPLMIYAFPFIHNSAEPYLSSKQACDYLLKNYKVDDVILSSKPFVRGVKYFTDKDVVAVDLPGKQFFSPHPIVFLAGDQQVTDFLKRRSITYAIFKKANLEDLERIAGKGAIKYRVLNKIGNEYVLEIETIPD